jgi:hypothetical protein
LILKPLANAEIIVAKRPGTQSDGELPSRRYVPTGAVVILAVVIGVVLVQVAEWLNALVN